MSLPGRGYCRACIHVNVGCLETPCSQCYEGFLFEACGPVRIEALEAQVSKLESDKADLRAKLDRAIAAGLKALQHKAAADRRSHRLETEYKAQLEEAKLHNSKEVEPLRASVAELRSLMTRVCDIAWEYQDA